MVGSRCRGRIRSAAYRRYGARPGTFGYWRAIGDRSRKHTSPELSVTFAAMARYRPSARTPPALYPPAEPVISEATVRQEPLENRCTFTGTFSAHAANPSLGLTVPFARLPGRFSVTLRGCSPEPITVKDDPLEPVPAGVETTIGPDAAPVGTVAMISVPEWTMNDAETPPNVTDVAPSKWLPVIVTDVPGAPLVGENDVMSGRAV
jgi:hypothetical protein